MTTNNAWNTPQIVTGVNGGTGVNNGSSTITIGGSLTLSGAYTFTGTLTNTTSVTFPTSGTLITNTVTTLSSLVSVSTITTGTWSAVLQDYTETNTAASSSTAYTINMANGNVFSITLTGNCTLSMSNVPASGCASLTIVLIQGSGPYTVTWPAAFIWPGGTAPTLTTTNGHVDVFVAITTNGGTTFRAFTSGQNFAS